MRPLLISDEQLKELKEFAEKNTIAFDEMKQIKDGVLKPMGDRPEHLRIIPVGYRVVYSIEQHFERWMRHVSVSVDAEGKLPSIDSVGAIMHELGFNSKLDLAHVYIEDERAINVLEEYK